MRRRATRAAALRAAAAIGCGTPETDAGPPRLAPFVPTPESVGRRMLSLAGTGPGDVVMDLGSGDGRLVILPAAEYGARGIRVERNAELVAESRRRAAAAGVTDRTRFVTGDIMDADVSETSVVTLYLPPSTNERLPPAARAAAAGRGADGGPRIRDRRLGAGRRRAVPGRQRPAAHDPALAHTGAGGMRR